MDRLHETLQLRQRLHERCFKFCNRIVFDAVTPSVYTTPIETVAETGRFEHAAKCGAFSKRYSFICRVNSETELI